jgi:hypothetical protein
MSAGDFAAGAGRLDYMDPDGDMFSVQQNGDAYDVVCPNGETFALSELQQQAIEGCTASADTAASCVPAADDIEFDDIGEEDLLCQVDNDCPRISGQQFACCGPSVGDGYKLCLVVEACGFL